MSNWFKRSQSWQNERYMGTVLAEVSIPFDYSDRGYEMAAEALSRAMQSAERNSPELISFKFTPQADLSKVS